LAPTSARAPRSDRSGRDYSRRVWVGAKLESLGQAPRPRRTIRERLFGWKAYCLASDRASRPLRPPRSPLWRATEPLGRRSARRWLVSRGRLLHTGSADPQGSSVFHPCKAAQDRANHRFRTEILSHLPSTQPPRSDTCKIAFDVNEQGRIFADQEPNPAIRGITGDGTKACRLIGFDVQADSVGRPASEEGQQACLCLYLPPSLCRQYRDPQPADRLPTRLA